MKRRVLGELLNAYADNRPAADAWLRATQPEDASVLTDLLELTNGIAALLVPINPSPEFVRELGTGLAAAAAPAEIIIAWPSSNKLWFGALLSGSLVSAAGVLIVWLMRRSRRSLVAAG